MISEPHWPPAQILTGTAVVLTPMREEDASDVAKALNDPALHEFTGGEVATAEQLRQRFAFLAVGRSPDGSEGWLNWVVRDRSTEVAVGTAQATLHQEAPGVVAAIAWVVGTPWQGRGLAKDAASALTSWLWTQDVCEISAYIHPDHAASAGVARSVGLSPTDTEVDGEVRWVVTRPRNNRRINHTPGG